jgi:CDP-glucose 4,6-dehydratase
MRSLAVKNILSTSSPVLVTGHTGFKGTWLVLLLKKLGIPVIGFSLPPEPTSLYTRLNLAGSFPEDFSDIRDLEKLERFILLHKPSVIFHLAAQPLVLKSYENPRYTFDVNVNGTLNIFEATFKTNFVKAIIAVSTDKVYKNDNNEKIFSEDDPLEGKDPYSASKVAMESAIFAWQNLQKIQGGPKIISVRAGNVIGGGDFAENRLIPDLIRAFLYNEVANIRNPKSKRPWQHVLEPLTGYILAAEKILENNDIPAINLGPSKMGLKVIDVVEVAKKILSIEAKYSDLSGEKVVLESESLFLNSQKAIDELNWRNVWTPEISIEKTISWWKKILLDKENPITVTNKDIIDYLENFNP